jgi:rhamnosyltransferase
MSRILPSASVIVRTKDSARTLGEVLSLVRAQTIPSEIIVVDSGSHDETLAIAREEADRVLEMPAERFSFGRALNLGAAVARARIHFALSSHTLPPDDRWIERSLSMYDRRDVAATTGAPTLPSSHQPLTATYYQTLSDATRFPWWGFSNTASSWRARVWREFPFDEKLWACEDKEWGFRVLAAGWTIAVDSTLSVSDRHRAQHGLRGLHRRSMREFEALGSFAALPPFTMNDLLREWLVDLPANGSYRRWRRRLNYYRFTELVGKYQGLKTATAPVVPPVRSEVHEPSYADAEGTAHEI